MLSFIFILDVGELLSWSWKIDFFRCSRLIQPIKFQVMTHQMLEYRQPTIP